MRLRTLRELSGPTGRAVTAQGHPRAIFRRALRAPLVRVPLVRGSAALEQARQAFEQHVCAIRPKP